MALAKQAGDAFQVITLMTAPANCNSGLAFDGIAPEHDGIGMNPAAARPADHEDVQMLGEQSAARVDLGQVPRSRYCALAGCLRSMPPRV